MHHHAWAMWNILRPRHLWAGRDGALTACTPYSFTLPIIHFDSCNQFHVHTYISHWGPGEQSPSLSQLVTGCVTCHTCHGCVTHFRPILGNIVEVTLVTFPILYIVSHAKGTSFP